MDRSSLAAGRGGGRAMDSARHGLLSRVWMSVVGKGDEVRGRMEGSKD
jgi:hypothetical protein